MSSRLVLGVAAILVAGVTNAYATVGGQTYILDVNASSSGEIKARVQFIDDGLGPADAGTVGIDIKNAGDYTGKYNAGLVSGVITQYAVTAVAPDDGFFTKFSGIAIDLKQAGGPVGNLANALGIAGRTVGFGFSTSGDLFFYTGEELLP